MTDLEVALMAALNASQRLLQAIGNIGPLIQDEQSCDQCTHWTRSDEVHARYGICRLASTPTSNDPLFVVAAGPGAHAPSGELRTNEDFSCSCYKGTPPPDA